MVRQNYHQELADLERLLLYMARITGSMVTDAVAALQQNDLALADSVITQDDVVDEMDNDIESRCIRLLALQQPVARDLRQIASALKIITDLERIGDHAVDIAKIARKLVQVFSVARPLIDISGLSEMALQMLDQSLEALIRHDAALARQVCIDDDRVDGEFKALRERLFALQQTDAALIAPISYMLLAIVYIERIADHATNIAERVNYVENGYLEPIARSHRRETLT